MLNLELSDGTAEAIVATPGAGSGPGVLMFMDAFGLRPRIEELAQRVAGWGYVVLAPNVFHRDGTVEELRPDGPPDWQAIAPRMGRLTTDRVEADIDAYVAALEGLSQVADGPIGVVGFCMGGRLAVRTASRYPEEVAACAALHTGGLVTTEDDSPHLGLGSARAAFLFGHADNDRSMTPEQVETLGGALDAAGLEATNVIVPGAAHGYTMSDTPAWNEEAFEWAFAELHELFDRTLH
ncbi:dienelactone hydrolase family protein [Propionicimonas sp.]|uniref:dienelactone hydrolase family protein n=1 Tax=Propionicimonas sp. TaxID=1955623 RepID=UPI0039E294E4